MKLRVCKRFMQTFDLIFRIFPDVLPENTVFLWSLFVNYYGKYNAMLSITGEQYNQN